MYKVLLRLPDKELQCRISWLFFTKNGRLWNCEICVHFVSPKLIQLKRVMLFLFAHINIHTHTYIYIYTHTHTHAKCRILICTKICLLSSMATEVLLNSYLKISTLAKIFLSFTVCPVHCTHYVIHRAGFVLFFLKTSGTMLERKEWVVFTRLENFK